MAQVLQCDFPECKAVQGVKRFNLEGEHSGQFGNFSSVDLCPEHQLVLLEHLLLQGANEKTAQAFLRDKGAIK